MFKFNYILRKLELTLYKIRQKKQAHFLKQLSHSTHENREKFKKNPRLKMTFLFISSILLVLTFQQLFVHSSSSKTNKSLSNKQKIQFVGTLISESKAIALINEKPMQVGDELYGLRIVAIHANKLDLKGSKGLISLNVGSTYDV